MPTTHLDPEDRGPKTTAINDSHQEQADAEEEIREVKAMKRRVCIDFDGVIHSYTSGWEGFDRVSDPPVEGAIEFLRLLIRAEVIIPAIFSSRSHDAGGLRVMQYWLRKHGLSPIEIRQIEWPRTKPPAAMYIDDRAWCFTGKFPTYNEMLEFDSWINR
jgi:hypothetical protein